MGGKRAPEGFYCHHKDPNDAIFISAYSFTPSLPLLTASVLVNVSKKGVIVHLFHTASDAWHSFPRGSPYPFGNISSKVLVLKNASRKGATAGAVFIILLLLRSPPFFKSKKRAQNVSFKWLINDEIAFESYYFFFHSLETREYTVLYEAFALSNLKVDKLKQRSYGVCIHILSFIHLCLQISPVSCNEACPDHSNESCSKLTRL